MTAALLAFAPLLLGLLAISALFSAAETALTGANRGRMHQLERDGDKAAKRVNRLISNQETMIGAVLIGYNVINIFASAMATEVITAVVPGTWGVAIATGVMTVLVVVFVEVLPKTLAITKPNEVARFLSAPIEIVVRLLGPVIFAIQWIVRKTLRIFGVRLDMGVDVLAAHEEIRGAVEYHHSEGAVESRDRRMLGGVLDLADMDVSDVMVHRKSIAMIDADLPSRELINKALESAHSRLPLYRDEPENIVGVIHAKDLLSALAKAGGDMDRLDIAAIAREPWFIPETTNLKDQLNAFLKRQSHFALVVDEYGGLQGLVTLEDILEEIVGEIQDEYDSESKQVMQLEPKVYRVDARMSLSDLNDELTLNLPEEKFHSVAGFVLHSLAGELKEKASFAYGNAKFTLLKFKHRQVKSVVIDLSGRSPA